MSGQNKLEIEIHRNIEIIVNQLIIHDFADEDIIIFTETVNFFSKLPNIKQYMLTALFDKIKSIREFSSPFRKIIGIIIDFNDQEINDALETYLIKDEKPWRFLILMEEKERRGLDLLSCETLFISLMGIKKYDSSIIDNFLFIIKKDISYLTSRLLHHKSYDALRDYIQELGENNQLEYLTLITRVVVSEYSDLTGYSNYLNLVSIIAYYAPENICILLHGRAGDIQSLFENRIAKSRVINSLLIKNYCNYLIKNESERFPYFEKIFLELAPSVVILEYAKEVTYSSKRLIIRRLIELQDERSLVKFINHFPEYKILLPLL